MSIPNLPVNFKDDILASSNPKRKYQQTFNTDGSVSLEDVTQYQQKGSDFGAKQVNQTNKAINNIYDERILTLEEAALVTEPGFFVDAQVITELNSKSIIESGQNDNGHYRKYADGTLEMWGRTGATVWITNTQGSIYYSNIIEINFPIASVSTANINIYVESSGIIWPVGATYDDNTLTAFRMAADRSISGLNVIYSWRATGTWK